jgi:hypothetical protein
MCERDCARCIHARGKGPGGDHDPYRDVLAPVGPELVLHLLHAPAQPPLFLRRRHPLLLPLPSRVLLRRPPPVRLRGGVAVKAGA